MAAGSAGHNNIVGQKLTDRVMKYAQGVGLAGLARAVRMIVAGLAVLALAGCGGSVDVGGLFSDTAPGTAQQQPQVSAGPAKVALLVPISAGGEPGRIGTAMKQAAELALFDAGNSGIVLVTKDTGGQPAGAQAAAQAAMAEGAQIILGPLLGSEVTAVSQVTRSRNVPVVAFSSVSAVAGAGTYLMSFLPEEEIDNVIRHASLAGVRTIGALVPNSQYGAVVESALRSSTRRTGMQIAAVERFERSSSGIAAPAQRIAQSAGSGAIQGLMIAEGGQLLNSISGQLVQNGFSPASVRVLGTGLWDDPSTAQAPVANGGWYAGVSSQSLTQFEQRFQQTYGARPHRLASLAYDATSLAIILARGGTEADRFSNARITNPEGFQGVNGLFRFRQDGRIQRGLSILQVAPGGNRVIAPAPTRFGNGS
jgi:ABC-type branched-subunit amino acid transport system substrate-binding protein